MCLSIHETQYWLFPLPYRTILYWAVCCVLCVAVYDSWIPLFPNDILTLPISIRSCVSENCYCCFIFAGFMLYTAIVTHCYAHWMYSVYTGKGRQAGRQLSTHLSCVQFSYKSSNREQENTESKALYTLDGKTVDYQSQSMAVRPSIKTFYTLCLEKIQQHFYSDKKIYTPG